MITTDQALEIISQHVGDFGTEQIALDQSLGRILKEDWFADRDLPPYNRVSMDGIAIQYSAYENGQRIFNIEGIAAAGSPQQTLQDGAACLEVMTGSVLPNNTDTVIRYEDLELSSAVAKVLVDTVQKDQNVHPQGKEGKHNILVSKMPKVIVISTGDELVEIDKTPLAHQIRKSNVYRLATSLKAHNIQANTAHLNDHVEEITLKIKEYLQNYDVIMLSGGVSKGKFDFIPEVLDTLGVKKLFHKIAQRPGKPFWFGKYKDRCTVRITERQRFISCR